jgi:hypothetical protein
MCSDLSGYTYSKYAEERSSVNANSKAFSIEASASVFGIGGSGGYSQSNSMLTEDQFNQFKETQSAYKQTTCSSSSSNSAFNSAVGAVSNIIDPTVSVSYTNCLKIYATGVQINQNNGIGSRSLSLDVQFVTNTAGAQAYITGIKYYGPALCDITGSSLPKGANVTFNFKLTPGYVYSIICTLPANTPADGGISDVYLSTTPGGTYHALLFHSTPVNQLTSLQNQIKSLSARKDSISIGAYYARMYPGGPVPMYTSESVLSSFVAPFNGNIIALSGQAKTNTPCNGCSFVLSVRKNGVEAIPPVKNFPLNGKGSVATSNKFSAGDQLSLWFGASTATYIEATGWMVLTFDQ